MEDDIKVDLGGVHWTELHQDSSYSKPLSLFDLGTEDIEGSSMGYFDPYPLSIHSLFIVLRSRNNAVRTNLGSDLLWIA